jgi:hypothetical protein
LSAVQSVEIAVHTEDASDEPQASPGSKAQYSPAPHQPSQKPQALPEDIGVGLDSQAWSLQVHFDPSVAQVHWLQPSPAGTAVPGVQCRDSQATWDV